LNEQGFIDRDVKCGKLISNAGELLINKSFDIAHKEILKDASGQSLGFYTDVIQDVKKINSDGSQYNAEISILTAI
jgi:hypothetical protein